MSVSYTFATINWKEASQLRPFKTEEKMFMDLTLITDCFFGVRFLKNRDFWDRNSINFKQIKNLLIFEVAKLTRKAFSILLKLYTNDDPGYLL